MTPSDLPAGWFTRAADRGLERTFIAETGWPSSPICVQIQGVCTEYFSFTEQDQLDYLNRVLSDAQARGIYLVNWWSSRDLLPQRVATSCALDPTDEWASVLDYFRNAIPGDPVTGELLLKVWGTMGFRDYDGALKATIGARWQGALSTPINPQAN